MDLAAAALSMQQAATGEQLNLMMLKQTIVEQQAVLQIVQAAQQSLPPPVDPSRGRSLDIIA